MFDEVELNFENIARMIEEPVVVYFKLPFCLSA
jgi:hypothetical protein